MKTYDGMLEAHPGGNVWTPTNLVVHVMCGDSLELTDMIKVDFTLWFSTTSVLTLSVSFSLWFDSIHSIVGDKFPWKDT